MNSRIMKNMTLFSENVKLKVRSFSLQNSHTSIGDSGFQSSQLPYNYLSPWLNIRSKTNFSRMDNKRTSEPAQNFVEEPEEYKELMDCIDQLNRSITEVEDMINKDKPIGGKISVINSRIGELQQLQYLKDHPPRFMEGFSETVKEWNSIDLSITHMRNDLFEVASVPNGEPTLESKELLDAATKRFDDVNKRVNNFTKK